MDVSCAGDFSATSSSRKSNFKMVFKSFAGKISSYMVYIVVSCKMNKLLTVIGPVEA